MAELNDAALENVVGGVTVIENLKKEIFEELIKNISRWSFLFCCNFLKPLQLYISVRAEKTAKSNI